MIIEWSEADDAYVATVPELHGCMADGRTRLEAVANAEQIIREWIETAKELGRPLPSKISKQRGPEHQRQAGGAIGKLKIVEDDDDSRRIGRIDRIVG
jgi:predicted RNase H-like HicB family nuclease